MQITTFTYHDKSLAANGREENLLAIGKILYSLQFFHYAVLDFHAGAQMCAGEP